MNLYSMLDKKTPIAVLASGRLGSSLAIALEKSAYNVVAVTSRRIEHRKWLKERLPNSIITDNFQTASNLADVVFITGPDAAIQDICNAVNWMPYQAVVHCAGALPVSALSHAASYGAAVAGFHPLQSFPTSESFGQLNGVSFATEAENDQLYEWLAELATDLGGSEFKIKTSERAAYHASAVMACGMTAGWIGVAAEMWAKLGIDREEALARLIPLIRATVDAIDRLGLPSAMTGPFVRGDIDTITMQFQATQEKSVDIGKAYGALAIAFLHIAEEQGALSDSSAEAIRALLLD